jgi:hypothetical protein
VIRAARAGRRATALCSVRRIGPAVRPVSVMDVPLVAALGRVDGAG